MAFSVEGFVIPGVKAAGDLSSDQHKFIKLDGSGDAAVNTVAGGPVDGVLGNKPDAAGKAAQVVTDKVAKVKAGAAVAAGDVVMSDAAGLAITATATNFGSGKALEAASGANSLIAVLLKAYGTQ